MRKSIFSLIRHCCYALSTENQQDVKTFNYDIDLLYGKWQVSYVFLLRSYVDVAQYPDLNLQDTYFTLNPDGTYCGSGYSGDKEGTYKALDNNIIIYVDNQEYVVFDVIRLADLSCELSINSKGRIVKIKCTKQ